MDTKMRTGEGNSTRAFKPKQFSIENDAERCPVTAYKTFRSHRPESMNSQDSPFYLAIKYNCKHNGTEWHKRQLVVVVFVFNVPPTAKVIWRRGHGLKSHPTDWWSRESNLRPLVYKASGLSTAPQRLHKRQSNTILNPMILSGIKGSLLVKTLSGQS